MNHIKETPVFKGLIAVIVLLIGHLNLSAQWKIRNAIFLKMPRLMRGSAISVII